jgi:hypothetical protein
MHVERVYGLSTAGAHATAVEEINLWKSVGYLI